MNAEDDESEDEYYTTERSLSRQTLVRLRNHLFAEEIAREERRKLYLELRAEFDPEPKPKRVVKYMADCLPEKEPLE